MYNLLAACSMCQGGSQQGYDLLYFVKMLFTECVLLGGKAIARIVMKRTLGSE